MKTLKVYQKRNRLSRRVAARLEMSKALIAKVLKHKQTTVMFNKKKRVEALKVCYTPAQLNWARWWKNILIAHESEYWLFEPQAI